MKKVILVLTIVILILTVACDSSNGTTGQNPQEQPGNNGAPSESNPPHSIGEGEAMFRFEMTDGEGTITAWHVHTNASTVGEALLEVGLIEGNVTDFGLMVIYVYGIRADFVEDSAWWAFYIDGEMAMAGVDATEIEEGVTYAFVCTDA